MHIFVIPDNFPSINNNMNIPGDFEYQVGKLYWISKYEQSSILPSYFVSPTTTARITTLNK